MTIDFMTTAGCHLCEQAWAMVEYLKNNDLEIRRDFEFRPVEISEKDELIEQYGIRIPVLVTQKGELSWPFEFEELVDWLKN